MLTYDLSFAFTSPYVAHPYWTEMFQVIEITKKSGMARAKSDANRRKSLEEYLRANGMTLADFERLEKLSKRPFHTRPDGEIFIPRDSVMAFLVAANDTARAAFKASPPEQVWTRIQATDFMTGKTKPDGIWTRYATVSLGTGAKASNQRGLRENAFIENFTASGQLTFDEQLVNPDALKNVIDWAGKFVGIGASRKMGRGRFNLTKFDLAAASPSLPLAAE